MTDSVIARSLGIAVDVWMIQVDAYRDEYRKDLHMVYKGEWISWRC
jgi:hypothetical protein